MTLQTPTGFDAFRALSALLGQDPLRVQGPWCRCMTHWHGLAVS